MLGAISLVLIIVEFSLLAIILYKIKTSSSKIKSLPYWCISAIIAVNFCIYSLGGLFDDSNTSIVFVKLVDAISPSIKSLAFTTDYDIVEVASSSSLAFKIAYIFGFMLACIATIGIGAKLFGYRLLNGLLIKKSLKKDCEIIVGYSEEGMQFAKSCTNYIFWDDNLSQTDYEFLTHQKIPVIRKKLTAKGIVGLDLQCDVVHNFVFIENASSQNQFVDVLDVFCEFLKEYYKSPANYKFGGITKHLFAEVQEDKIDAVQSVLHSSTWELKIGEGLFTRVNFVKIFSRYNLISRQLFENYTLTEFLGSDFKDNNGCIKADKKIEVYMLGFGKVNREILKSLIINNQMISEKSGEIVTHLVNYHVCDPKVDRSCNVCDCLENQKILLQNKDEYFDLPDVIANLNFIEDDLYSDDMRSELKRSICDKNSYTFIFISLGDTFEDINLAEKLYTQNHGCENYHIFARVRDKKILNDIKDNERLTYFGSDEGIMVRGIIIDENLNFMAKEISDRYDNLKATGKRWDTLPLFEVDSNVTKALNFKTKLNLIGYDLKEITSENQEKLVSREEYYLKYCGKQGLGEYLESMTYDDYFNTEILRSRMIMQEHMRWNSYYIMNGYSPMKISDFTLAYRKDLDKKIHACITSYNGLHNLHQHIVALNAKVGVQTNCSNIEFYQYDATLLDDVFDIVDMLNKIRAKNGEKEIAIVNL